MYKIDLNCDLGESYGAYHLGMDEEIIPMISSANVVTTSQTEAVCIPFTVSRKPER